jgi:hypothetical protein
MNEQTKELMEQAGFDPEAIERMGLMPQVENFIDVIVQECILVIEENAKHIHAEGTIEAIVNLEKHFGVD